MSSTSGSTWLFVDGAPRNKLRRRGSDNNLADPRTLGCISVSPKELQQQQALFDFYTKQKLERVEERRADSSQQPTPSGFRRHLKSLPSAVPSRGKHGKEITTSSTGATVGEYVPPEGRSQTLALPPPSSFRHKHTVSQPPPPNMPWGLAPLRSATDPMYLPPTTGTGALNVNKGGGASPPMPVPQLPHHHSAPPAVQGPFSLPLQSLPPGYDFALAAHFRPEANKLRPLRLLSLDGGGVRGISSLQILKTIMDRIKPGARPCDYFDLIAGTSTGGLIAIMLGRLRMTVDECIQHYHHLAKKIFKRNPALQYGSLAMSEHRFSPENLEEAIKSVVGRKAPRNSKMADDHPRCARTFVIAVRKHNVNNQPARRIRSYATQTSPADTCEIWQAGRATSAAPSYFPPIEIPDERGRLRSYIDGGLGYNNPCKELFNEAREVFGPHHEIGCFLSIGTGRDRNIQFGDVRKPNSAYQAFKHIALNSHHAHLEMQEYFSRKPGVYFRFNAGDKLIEESENQEDFVQAVALEDWHKMASIEASTKKYLEEERTTRQIARCAKTLARIAQTDKQQRPS